MHKKNNPLKKITTARNPKEIAKALGISSETDLQLMNYKAQLSTIARNAIHSSELRVTEIVKNSGVARSKVSAIKNGALSGISCDLFIKVISATGCRLSIKLAS